MTGNFLVTHAHFDALDPYADDKATFYETYPPEKFPNGIPYQQILDEAVADDHDDYAAWLLEKLGPTKDVLELEEIDSPDKAIVFAGTIIVRGSFCCRNIKAGGYINAGGYIKAEEHIEAKGRIKAEGNIEAGEGHIDAGGGIKAGGYIKAWRYIEARGNIEAGRYIEAGREIKAGGHIKAKQSIKAGRRITAGWNIKAGEHIEAGEEYGIFAGIYARISYTGLRAITAAEKPENIMCGVFVPATNAERAWFGGAMKERRKHSDL